MKLLGMAALSEKSYESKAQQGSGGRQEEPTTADTVERDAVSRHRRSSPTVTQGVGRVASEVSCSPNNSSRSTIFGAYKKRRYVFFDGETLSRCEYYCCNMQELHRFDTAFERGPYVWVGGDGSDSVVAQGATTLMYVRKTT